MAFNIYVSGETGVMGILLEKSRCIHEVLLDVALSLTFHCPHLLTWHQVCWPPFCCFRKLSQGLYCPLDHAHICFISLWGLIFQLLGEAFPDHPV